MPSFTGYALAALVAAVPFSSAQTSTKCNPLKESCPPDGGLNQYNFYSDFTQGDSALDGWTTTAGKVTTNSKGAVFTINKQGDAPTIQSEFAIFFGELEVKMQAAPGTGIVSSLVFESDDLDEIDWEVLGGDTTQVQSDYFGKGNTSTYDRATFINVNSPQTSVHTYSVVWTSASIVWYVDGNSVRTLQYADAVGGSNFPQTPMRIRIGIWAGGDPSNGEGTIEWAGGETDFSKAPFTMYVESVKVINYNPASTYTYTDQTGSYQSIKASNSSTTSGSFSASSSDEPSSSSTSSSSSSSTSNTSGSSSDSPSALAASGSLASSGASSTGQTSSGASAVSLGGSFMLLTLITGLFNI
ncbi:copper resistance protein [Monascus purpureus]|uniref:Crh-like protein n=1 Tax=Monascus purpureus TaxID=5098 RepID=A0A507R2V0_MONPU|nr:copper resistance protein [Monascus purpureus]